MATLLDLLGTGMAKRAGSALAGRRAKIDAAVDGAVTRPHGAELGDVHPRKPKHKDYVHKNDDSDK